MQLQDEKFMVLALDLAKQAACENEVPVGALIVIDGKVIGEGYNQPIARSDPTAHAEMIAMRAAARKITNYRLLNASLYVTLEPCAMCAGAMVHARINRLIYGATDPKAGAISSVFQLATSSQLNHQIDCVGGLLADECGALLRQFFRSRRKSGDFLQRAE